MFSRIKYRRCLLRTLASIFTSSSSPLSLFLEPQSSSVYVREHTRIQDQKGSSTSVRCFFTANYIFTIFHSQLYVYRFSQPTQVKTLSPFCTQELGFLKCRKFLDGSGNYLMLSKVFKWGKTAPREKRPLVSAKLI